MAEKAQDVDAFVAVSEYYAHLMRERLHLSGTKVHVVHIGICPEEYTAAPLPVQPPVIGFLSRLSQHHGVGILMEAFVKLKSQARFANLRLHLTGGYTEDDESTLRNDLRRLDKMGLSEDVRIFADFDRAHRTAFFKGISVLTVPVLHGEAFGSYLIEALACGVPVVQPDAGAFPELVHKTKGGIIYRPNTPDALAQALGKILSDLRGAHRMGEEGRKNVMKYFTVAEMARKTLRVYDDVIKSKIKKSRSVKAARTDDARESVV